MTTVVIGDNTGNDFSGTEDTQLNMASATTNYGTSVTMEATKYDSSSHIHSLLKFSGISNITGPVTVTSTTISVRQFDANGASNTISLYRVLRNWVEAEATWNIWSTGNNWTTAGCLSDGNDRSGTVSASLVVDNTNNYKNITGSQLDTDYQDFINGSVSNYGHHIIRTDAADDGNWRVYRTSDYSDGARPYVTIVYTAGGGGGTTNTGWYSSKGGWM